MRDILVSKIKALELGRIGLGMYKLLKLSLYICSILKCCVPGLIQPPPSLNLHRGNRACPPQWVQASGSVSGNLVRLFVNARSK